MHGPVLKTYDFLRMREITLSVKGALNVTIRYDTRCCFNVRSKADMNRLNLPHGDDN